ncbi:phosphoesterase, DHHA1 [Plesiocystis pacifica SIR-1]|uniref:Phosphoesterase, DHHA1 n=1 Tax=Plesiocystis pacifica SIR-1 TaxID=391625 RepID=A6G171_9BACT|nr:hypothetical protein [Plesiocystis pacifica]EDM80366.1 phosphoesterase, DHHA1 [Plesiocystis pacifica SIR-1]
MRVHVLHHARCFDGAASAALFAAFARARHGKERLDLRFLPKQHRQGDPFDDGDFEGADEAAIVDFRYSQRPGLSWYFDHHRSAFQLPGDREHFEADTSGQKFHDPTAPSCTGYLARVVHEQFGVDLSAHAELIRWGEIIDSADFATPEVAVLYEQPAMHLAAWIQTASDPEAIAGFIEALLTTPFERLAKADWVRALVEPRLASHREDIELLRRRVEVGAGVCVYDLVDDGPRVLSHFIPYYLDPSIRYSIGAYAHPDGDLRLSVGFNPWLAPETRRHDLAQLCEAHGGGGHPFVAGAAFALSQRADLDRAVQGIASVLRGPA